VIRTTSAARRLVATLAAVLIAGIVGLGAIAGFSAPDRRIGSSSQAADRETLPSTQVVPAIDLAVDHVPAVDLPTVAIGPAPVLGGLTVALLAVVAVLIGREGRAVPVPAGRAPPQA